MKKLDHHAGQPNAPARLSLADKVFGAILAAVGTGLVALMITDTLVGGVEEFITLALLPAGIVALFVFSFLNSKQDIAVDVAKAEEELKRLSEAVTADDDLPSLSLLIETNRQEILRYHGQTRNQANLSFFAGMAAMGVGLLVLVAGGIAIFNTSNVTRIAAATALTAVGSGLSGFIGATFMRAHDRALAQLNFYFQQPVVVSYFLAAERLADGTPERKADILERIIDRSLMTASAVSRDAGRFLHHNGQGLSAEAGLPSEDKEISGVDASRKKVGARPVRADMQAEEIQERVRGRRRRFRGRAER